jgi:hypothetical protein
MRPFRFSGVGLVQIEQDYGYKESQKRQAESCQGGVRDNLVNNKYY